MNATTSVNKVFRYGLLLAMCFNLMLLAACNSNTATDPTQTNLDSSSTADDPIRIGGLFALSGFGKEWGLADLQGAQLAIEEVNEAGGIDGRNVELVVEDTQSDNVATLSAARKLVDVDGLDVIIGPTWFETFMGPASLSEEGILFVAPSASVTTLKEENSYPNIFTTWYRLDTQIKQLVLHLKENNLTRVAFFFGIYTYWQDTANQFTALADQHGIEIVDEYWYTDGVYDFNTPLTKLKDQEIDAVIYGFFGEKDTTVFLQQASLFIPDVVLYSDISIEGFLLDRGMAEYAEGFRYIVPRVPESDFFAEYQVRFGDEASLSAANSYDAATVLIDAMQHGNFDPVFIREHLLENEFETVSYGMARFDELGGVVGGEYEIKVIQGGVAVVLE